MEPFFKISLIFSVLSIALTAWNVTLVIFLLHKTDKSADQHRSLLRALRDFADKTDQRLSSGNDAPRQDIAGLRTEIHEVAQQVKHLHEQADRIFANRHLREESNLPTDGAGRNLAGSIEGSMKALKSYLELNYQREHQEILSRLASLGKHLDNPTETKDQLIHLSMRTGLPRMNQTRLQSFLQTTNDYLSRVNISIFMPTIGEEYNEATMNKKKQLSASNRVTELSCFGLMHGDQIIVKADVSIG